MNIKVDRDLFLSELYYLQGVVGAKQLIPILSHLLIEAVHVVADRKSFNPRLT